MAKSSVAQQATSMNPLLVEQLTQILEDAGKPPRRSTENFNPQLCDPIGRLCAVLEGADAIMVNMRTSDPAETQQWQLSKAAFLINVAQDIAEELSHEVGLR